MLDRSILVPGRPVPQGSLRSMRTPQGFVVSPQQPKVLTYRGDIRAQWGEPTPVSGPVAIWVSFLFARPKSHYLPANRSRPSPVLRDDAPMRMAQSPDIDKLARSVLDALTGYAYRDDQQVTNVSLVKEWAEGDMTHIHIEEVTA